MLMEMFFVTMVSFSINQNSAFIMSIMIIPISLSLSLICNSFNLSSGIFILLYVMMFIGGLIILLVSMASINNQDQISSISTISWLILLMIMTVLFMSKQEIYSNSLFLSVVLLENMILLVFIIMNLILALCVFSLFIQLFKGLIRTL